MSSPFDYMDVNLSKLTSDKIVQEIKHIDDDACIQITFSDNSYIVVDAMLDKITRSGAIPILNYYGIDGKPVPYFENDYIVS